MKKFFTIVSLITISSIAFAQYGIHAGVSFPMGSFAEDDLESLAIMARDGKRGGANTGFMVGIKVNPDLSAAVQNMYLTLSVEFMYNKLSSDITDQIEDVYSRYSGMDYTFSKYINIPVLLGAGYKIPIQNTTSLFFEGAIGANVAAITKQTIEQSITGSHTKIVDSYEAKSTFVFKLGGGFMFNNKIALGLHYYGFSKFKVEGDHRVTSTGSISQNDSFKLGKLSQSMLTIDLTLFF